MAVREFDGVDDVISLALGACATLGGGDLTVAAVVKLAGNDGTPWWLGDAGTTNPRVYWTPFSANWLVSTDFSAFPNTVPIVSGQWVLVSFSKVAGTATPRGHHYRYDTDAWLHQDASGTTGAPSNTGSAMNLGRAFNDSLNGRLAAVGVWDTVLSDGQLDGMTDTLQAWFDLAPVGLWRPGDDTVVDLTGNGADQTAITGTTIVTDDDPPGFDLSISSAAEIAVDFPVELSFAAVLSATSAISVDFPVDLTFAARLSDPAAVRSPLLAATGEQELLTAAVTFDRALTASGSHPT